MSGVLLKQDPAIDESNSTKIGIPPQPRLLFEIERVYPDIDKVAELIRKDPAVADGVLRVVNSPCIGLSRDVARIEQAVILLGLDAVMNIVNSVLLQQCYTQQLNQQLLNTYWKNTLHTAIASGLLAKLYSNVRPDDAYVLGLFHNCAIPLILGKYSNYLDVLRLAYRDAEARITLIEEKNFRADHATVGHYIARAWNLPGPIVTAVRDHHNPQRLNGGSIDEIGRYTDQLCAILKLSEHITRTYQTFGHQERDNEWELYQEPVLRTLHIDSNKLSQITDATVNAVNESHHLHQV